MNDEIPDRWSITELAERAGLTRRTIRYYVAEGLLPAPGGRGQHRAYTADHLVWLQAIRRLKAAFLPLSEIRRRLATMTPADRRALADERAEAATTCEAVDALASLLTSTLVPGHRPLDPGIPSLGGFLASGAALPGIGAAEPTRRPGAIGFRPGPATPGPEDPAGSVWRRVALAPGVELHYQLSGDRRRDEAIAHLIRAASSILR